MSIEMTLLGLLRDRPRHGYDLAREFADGTVLSDIVHLEPSLLYANLKKLERAQLVRSRVETQGARPPRRILELTDRGSETLERWLAEPVERTRDLRLEFLLKLYIARGIEPLRVESLVAEQVEVCHRFIGSLRDQIATESDDFRRLVLEMRLVQNQALVEWLEQTRLAEHVQRRSSNSDQVLRSE